MVDINAERLSDSQDRDKSMYIQAVIKEDVG
jgi:hypothetical protein